MDKLLNKTLNELTEDLRKLDPRAGDKLSEEYQKCNGSAKAMARQLADPASDLYAAIPFHLLGLMGEAGTNYLQILEVFHPLPVMTPESMASIRDDMTQKAMADVKDLDVNLMNATEKGLYDALLSGDVNNMLKMLNDVMAENDGVLPGVPPHMLAALVELQKSNPPPTPLPFGGY